MTREKGSRTGRCQGCNHIERVRIERLLAAGAGEAVSKSALRLRFLRQKLEDKRPSWKGRATDLEPRKVKTTIS